MLRRSFIASLFASLLPGAAKIASRSPNGSIVAIKYTAKDMQFLETRRLDVKEIGRIFRVPPEMMTVLDTSISNGKFIEVSNAEYWKAINHAA